MTRLPTVSTFALAAGLVGLCSWFLVPHAPAASLRAGGDGALVDTDGDFLPDVVEWAVLTNPNNPDTDGDQIGDFIEVVQRGSPRHSGAPLPNDHEMRVVMTGPSLGHPNDPTYLHIFFRFFGGANLVTSFATWLEAPAFPGLHLPLNVLGFSNLTICDRVTTNDGYWLRISVPLVSEQILRNVLPCTIRAQATIGGNVVTTGVLLVDVQNVTCSLVPFGDGRHALQSIGVMPLSLPVSNRVCVLALEAAGSGPGGTLYEVVDADCEDCNELECGPSCVQSIGWFINVPGGLQNL